ncbi:unnamed protein product [Symbiodinium microadriaticum]|nr:unnamed protein product [Symbiodinium microadriaticum]
MPGRHNKSVITQLCTFDLQLKIFRTEELEVFSYRRVQALSIVNDPLAPTQEQRPAIKDNAKDSWSRTPRWNGDVRNAVANEGYAFANTAVEIRVLNRRLCNLDREPVQGHPKYVRKITLIVLPSTWHQGKRMAEKSRPLLFGPGFLRVLFIISLSFFNESSSKLPWRRSVEAEECVDRDKNVLAGFTLDGEEQHQRSNALQRRLYWNKAVKTREDLANLPSINVSTYPLTRIMTM